MKKTLIATAAALTLVAPYAFAQQPDDLIAQLQGQGYDVLEVEVGPTQIKVEAVKDTQMHEQVYDRATGELLAEDVGPVSADDSTGDGKIEIEEEDHDFLAKDGTISDDDDDDHDDDDDDHDDEDEDEDEKDD